MKHLKLSTNIFIAALVMFFVKTFAFILFVIEVICGFVLINCLAASKFLYGAEEEVKDVLSAHKDRIDSILTSIKEINNKAYDKFKLVQEGNLKSKKLSK